jgi:outer membrane protein insertion porin family
MQNQLSRIYNLGVTYTYEVVNLDTTSVGDADIQPDLTSLYNKSSVTMGLSQTTTNDLFSPTKGFNNGLTFKVSGVGPSTYNYTKLMLDVRHFLQIPRAVLATRLKVGQINSADKSGFIPVEDRFYAGGANSVRGWARHELGPEDEHGKPLGGNSLIEGSLELRIPVMGSFNSALFWDFGNVWAKDFSKTVDELRHALGAGIRFHTPIGPVRFDIATPVLDQDTHIRWHLTLGQAF